jgi:Xaa-Pro aminopeptidase
MSRISRIQSNLPKDAIFLVSNPINIRYLCGFTGSSGLLLLKANQATLYTDFRYEIQANQELVDCDCKVVQDIWNAVKADLDCQIVLVEENHITFAQFENLKVNHNSISFM